MGRVDFGLIGEKFAHLADKITSHIQQGPIIEGSLLLLVLIELICYGSGMGPRGSHFLAADKYIKYIHDNTH